MNNASGPDAALRFPFPGVPEHGEVWEVAPGVGWLRMPIPGVLNHINLWILRGADGVTLVDTGMPTDQARAIWEDVLENILEGATVNRVLCTHHHPDHMGLSAWLCARTGAPLLTTKPEFEAGRRWQTIDVDESESASVGVFERAGIDPDIARGFLRNRGGYKHLMGEVPETADFIDIDTPIAAADTTWQFILGRGHSPELVGLYSAGLEVVISSDQVLPKISPNVSVTPLEPDADPLQLYLSTLRNFRRLPPETLVLPSHRQPFYGLQTRVDDLTMHHQERLDATREACGTSGAIAGTVMRKLFPRVDDGHQMFSALGETLAHLNFLIGTGEIARDRSGAQDIYRTT